MWHDEKVTLSGKLLVAGPQLLDPNFWRTVVLLLEHNDDGAVGLVLNRVIDEPAAVYLPAWEDHLVPPGLVHYGGPVEPEVAIGLGRSATASHAGVPGLAMVDLTVAPDEDTPKVRVYSGYSGWSRGQLEEELESGAWFVVDAAPDDVFAEADSLWRNVLRRQPGSLSMVGLFPEDPSLN
ncbi:MAG TPA: YqgE/AlgH family protein [Acidimicrobiia bacterium]